MNSASKPNISRDEDGRNLSDRKRRGTRTSKVSSSLQTEIPSNERTVDATISMRLRSRRGSLISRQTSTTASPTITRQSSVESSLDGRANLSMVNGTEINHDSATGYTSYVSDHSGEEESDNAVEEELSDTSPGSAEYSISGESHSEDDGDEIEKAWTKECRNQKNKLLQIRTEFNLVKERVFINKEKDLEREKEEVENGMHPELQRLGEKDTDRRRREKNAEQRRSFRENSVTIRFEAQQKQAVEQYMAERRSLRRSMIEEMQLAKHRLNAEYNKMKSKEPSNLVMDLMIKQMEDINSKKQMEIKSRPSHLQPKIIAFNLRPQPNDEELEEDLREIRHAVKPLKAFRKLKTPTTTPNPTPITTPTHNTRQFSQKHTPFFNTHQCQRGYTHRDYGQREYVQVTENQRLKKEPPPRQNAIVNAWLASGDDNDSDKESNAITNQYRGSLVMMMMDPERQKTRVTMSEVLANRSC